MIFWIFIAALYAPPAVRLILAFFRFFALPFSRAKAIAPDDPDKRSFLKVIADVFAEYEYVINPPRFFLIGIPLTLVSGYAATAYFTRGAWPFSARTVALIVGFAALNAVALDLRRSAELRLAEYLRERPRIHPRDFFRLFKRDLAFGVRDIFDYPSRDLLPDEADFRAKGRPEHSRLRLVAGVLDTYYVTSIIIVCTRKLGPVFGREVAECVTTLWGKRMLQLARNRLCVEGLERLNGKRGRFLLISNHKSTLDFVFCFFALSEVIVGHRRLKPRFIVAKDHFKDNFLIHRILGIGIAIEVLGMVFIERKNREKSFENLRQAARDIVQNDVDIAIFPQGTRAMGNFDRAGKRRDAGYYTTVPSRDPSKPLAHLKKGTAHLILDTLVEMRATCPDEHLHLVFIGIQGTASTLPRGSLTVQTENTVTFNVGDVVALPAKLADELIHLSHVDEAAAQSHRNQFVERMNALIDDKLTEAMGLHDALKKRFLTDLKGAFRYEPDKIEAISRALDAAAKHSPGVYQIIDRIYSLPPSDWNGYLSQLCQLLQGRIDVERFQPILQDVSEKLVA